MKFGPIICDPNSNEAKCLRGKRVVSFRNYTDFNKSAEERYSPMVVGILNTDDDMFVIEDETDNGFVVAPFIAEIIEEKPKYRPYESCEEMVEDFCERFGIVKNDYSLPMIWMKAAQGSKILITAFSGSEEHVSFSDGGYAGMVRIFRDFTYLDGSPVGKEVKDD